MNKILLYFTILIITACATKPKTTPINVHNKKIDIYKTNTNIINLESKVEHLNNRIYVMTEEINILKNIVKNTQINKVTNRTKIKKITKLEPETLNNKMHKRYNFAYKLFLKKQFKLAKEKFNDFLQKYPDSNLSDNAIYWVAKIYKKQNKLSKAISTYQKLLKDLPHSSKVPYALADLIRIYKKKKNIELVKKYQSKLINNYPDSKPAKNLASNQVM